MTIRDLLNVMTGRENLEVKHGADCVYSGTFRNVSKGLLDAEIEKVEFNPRVYLGVTIHVTPINPA